MDVSTGAASAQSNPLRLLPGIELTPQQVAQLERIAQVDLWFVRERLLTKDGDHTPAEVDEAIAELRRYLALHALGYRDLGMTSTTVDDAWHAFILFTREYTDFCEEVFGHYLHHAPTKSTDPPQTGAALNFEEAYRRTFGELGEPWRPRPRLTDAAFGMLLAAVHRSIAEHTRRPGRGPTRG